MVTPAFVSHGAALFFSPNQRRCAISHRSSVTPFASSADDLSGQARGILRSEAGRRSAAGKLATLSSAAPPADDDLAEQVWSRKMYKPVDDLLAKHELIRVKVRGAGKRRRALHLGSVLANSTNSCVAQSLGHTVLLYRERAEGSQDGVEKIDLNPQPRKEGEDK